MSLQFVM